MDARSTKLRTREAATYIRLSQSTLSKMRMRGNGPIFSKAGPRIIVYDVADLNDWLSERKRRSTSDPGETGRG